MLAVAIIVCGLVVILWAVIWVRTIRWERRMQRCLPLIFYYPGMTIDEADKQIRAKARRQ